MKVNSLLSFRRSRTQRGAVLVIALILLLAVSLIGVMAMRGAISGEQVSKSLRSSVAAQQSAETAIRYCEDQVLFHAGGGLTLLPAPDQELWKTRANWTAVAGKANVVPKASVNSTDTAARQMPDALLPRCMIEELRLRQELGGPTVAYRVTALGYSLDYKEDASGRPLAGGEAWLQSMVRR